MPSTKPKPVRAGRPYPEPPRTIAPADGPIQRRKLYQEVLDRLLVRVRAGEFEPGAALPSERQLMEAYAVGRPAVREALFTLQKMGLLTISHGGRARLREVSADSVISQVSEVASYLLETSPTSLENLKEARLFFEVGMVRIAAEKATRQDVGRLRQALDEHRAALGDASLFLAKDMAFHRAIASVSRNPIFAAISRAMLQWLERYYVDLVLAPGREPIGFSEHQRILQCIAAHDPDGAGRAMAAHLKRANKLYTRTGGGLGGPRK
jgi:GntR family transcriptional regulator, sialic acid-inducible nan operon repressor